MSYFFEVFQSKKNQFVHIFSVLGFYSFLYILFFSPTLFSGKLLAPGDSFFIYLPNFILGTVIWDPLIAGGYPAAADLQSSSWYPIWHFFRLFRYWNGFVISAYILSACFVYGYMYSITKSKFASLVSGIIYSMSGFMIGHLSHTTIIHSAIWFPLFIWALHMISHEFNWAWFATGSFSIAFSLLSGHPQIPFYMLIVGIVYFFVLTFTKKEKFKFYAAFVGIVVLGIALAAVQLLPSFEFLRLILRSRPDFSEFISLSIQPYQLLQFVFPNLLGGSGWPFQKSVYFGPGNPAELNTYVGLLPLLLSIVAIGVFRKRILVWLWVGVILYAVLMAFGDTVPLAKLMYHMPVYNKLRGAARHLILFTFAISILAGLGITAIQSRLISWKSTFNTALIGVIFLVTASAIPVLLSSRFNEMADRAGLHKIEWYPWSNFSSGIPLVLFFLSTIILLLLYKDPSSVFRKFCVILILILDLSMFGWFRDWRTGSKTAEALTMPPGLEKYRAILESDHQRMLPFRGVLASKNEPYPNVSRLWKINSASIYTSSMPTRISKLLSMTYWGQVEPAAFLETDQSFNLMAVRYLSVSKSDVVVSPLLIQKHGLWAEREMFLSLRRHVENRPDALEFQLPSVKLTSIGVVSNLSWSASVPDNQEVARISATDVQGNVQEIDMLAGRDTSEWAIDCLPNGAAHRRARVFQSHPYHTTSQDCNIHSFVAKFSLKNLSQIEKLKIQVIHPKVGFNLRKLSLWNEAEQLAYHVPPLLATLNDGMRWQKKDQLGNSVIYENRFARQRAWLVTNVLGTKKMLDIIKSSRMPDGSKFESSKVALVEEGMNLNFRKDKNARISLKDVSGNTVEVATKSRYPAFLVLSDVYYPGWKASIDGKQTRIYRTNYVFRGVLLPAGRHLVRFEFRPTSLYIGALVSSFSLLAVMILLGRQFIRPR